MKTPTTKDIRHALSVSIDFLKGTVADKDKTISRLIIYNDKRRFEHQWVKYKYAAQNRRFKIADFSLTARETARLQQHLEWCYPHCEFIVSHQFRDMPQNAQNPRHLVSDDTAAVSKKDVVIFVREWMDSPYAPKPEPVADNNPLAEMVILGKRYKLVPA